MTEKDLTDSHDRRLAGRRALALAEAGSLVRVLHVLLQRANFDVAACVELAAQIGTQEQTELMRAYGHIESRRRFKHRTGHPLLEGKTINLLSIDECGQSGPEPHKDKSTFAIGAVAMSEGAAQEYVRAVDALKQEFFGDLTVTFHEPFMRRGTRPFYFGGNVARQQEFRLAVDTLIASTPFTAFGVGIRKTQFLQGLTIPDITPYLPTDIYAASIALLLERYVDYLAAGPNALLGRITFESQGPKEDAIHQLEYARTLVDGTQWVAGTNFQHLLESGIRFIPKGGSSALELADMFARDLYEWVHADCQGTPGRWQLFQSKIYCRGDGRMGKFGVKIFPDSDIRERIEDHRQAVRDN